MRTITFLKGVSGVVWVLAALFIPPSASGQVLNESAKLVASDAVVNDQFGQSVSISGDTVVVGAQQNDAACPGNINCNSGSAYVFVRSGGVWTQQQKLTALDAAAGD